MQANSVANFTGNLSTCSTPECAATAKSILEFIDLNVDPCSDFYQYACGSWLSKAVIADDRTSVGTLENASDVNTDVMRSILEGDYSQVYQSLFTTDEGFHTADEAAIDKQNFDLMQSYYNVCLNEDQINSLGPTPIYLDIANIENILFPVKNGTEMFSKNATPLISQTIAALTKQSIFTLNTFYINPDDKNPDINAVLFEQVNLGLPSKEYYEDPSIIAKYKSGLTDILTKVLGEYSNGTQDEAVRVSESQKANFTRWSNAKIAASVDRYIEFESRLANISLKNDEMQDPIKLYNPVKLSTFQAQHPMIDWTSILQAIIPNGIQIPDIIINRTPEYYSRLNTLLANGTISLQALQEYFIIAYVNSKVYSLDSASRAASTKMNGEISSGTSVEQPRWRTCTSYTSNSISNTLGRYYVLKQFGGESERKKAQEFLTTIHNAWIDRLPGLDWLDNQTLAKAIEKVKLISHKVGYSIASPDLRKPSSIKEYYDGFQVNTTSFYDTESNYGFWYTEKTWQKAGQEVDKDEWLMSPQTVNAYYTPNGNEIVIPAGILQTPFYDVNYPDYLNYGGIGMVIGHELTHAFDNSGRKYDGLGRLVDWWTNATTASFDNKTQCFVQQYSKFNVTGPDNKKMNVNGQLTLGENLADNGGIAASLSAFHALNKTTQLLPGLEQLSPEALFFINFGRAWCTKERPEVALQLVFVDPHSPSPARVNGVVQNSPDFAKAFNCPAGSPMNPKNKCSIW